MKNINSVLDKLYRAMAKEIDDDIPEPKPDALTGCNGEPIGVSWPFLSKKTSDMPANATKCQVIRAYYNKLRTHLDQCRAECLKSKNGGFDEPGFAGCLKRKLDAYTGGGAATSVELYMAPEALDQQVKPNDNLPPSTVDPRLVKECEKRKLKCQCTFLSRKFENMLESAREAELFINKCVPEYRTPNPEDPNRPSLHEQFRRRCFPVRDKFPSNSKCSGIIGRYTYGEDCQYVCLHCGVTS